MLCGELQAVTRTMPDAPAPVTTIMFTAHFLDVADAPLDVPWWLHSKMIHADKGYATFETRLYRPDGRLGAWAEQLVGVYDG